MNIFKALALYAKYGSIIEKLTSLLKSTKKGQKVIVVERMQSGDVNGKFFCGFVPNEKIGEPIHLEDYS